MDALLDPINRDALRTAISHGLQFAFTKVIVMGGKPKKCWSQARGSYLLPSYGPVMVVYRTAVVI